MFEMSKNFGMAPPWGQIINFVDLWALTYININGFIYVSGLWAN